MITFRQRQMMALRTQAAPGTRAGIDGSVPSPGALHDCIPGDVVHARAYRGLGTPCSCAGGEGQRRDLRDDLTKSLRRRHERTGTRWRLLSPLAQAVLVIAFLRTNLTYAELAAGFGISESTCWREVAEGISVLADWTRGSACATWPGWR